MCDKILITSYQNLLLALFRLNKHYSTMLLETQLHEFCNVNNSYGLMAYGTTIDMNSDILGIPVLVQCVNGQVQ